MLTFPKDRNQNPKKTTSSLWNTENPVFSEWLLSRHPNALKNKNRLSYLSGKIKKARAELSGLSLCDRKHLPNPLKLWGKQAQGIDEETTWRRQGQCHTQHTSCCTRPNMLVQWRQRKVLVLFQECSSFWLQILSFSQIFIEYLLYIRHYSRPYGYNSPQNKRKYACVKVMFNGLWGERLTINKTNE